jgi:hypothetical protein
MTPSWFRRAWRYLSAQWVRQHGLRPLTSEPDLPLDHRPYIRPDHSVCCDAHDEAFYPNRESTERLGQALPQGPFRRYIEERMGNHPSPYPPR